MPIKSKYLLVAIFPVAALGIAACGGGFESAKPDQNQIMSIINTALGMPVYDEDSIAEMPNRVWPDGPEGPFSKFSAPLPIEPHNPPYLPMGRLLFSVGSSSYRCSAQFISADVIITAGHCVYDDVSNRWSSGLVFQQGYTSGSTARTYDWQCAAIFTGWAQGAFSKDYAFVKLRGSSSTFFSGPNLSLPNSFQSIGYPSNFGGGETPYAVDGSKGRVIDGVVEMLGNPFYKGASGGAWLSGTSVVGLNSFVNGANNTEMWGPRFDGQTTRLFEFVRNGCPANNYSFDKSPEVLAAKGTSARIAADNTGLSYGVDLTKSKSDMCSCDGAEGVFLRSDSDNDYVANISYVGFADDKEDAPSGDVLSLRVNASQTDDSFVGCTRGTQNGDSCSISINYALQSVRRIIGDQELLKIDRAAQTKLGPERSVTPEFCEHQCVNNPDGGYCQKLGSNTGPIVASLSGFLADTVDTQPDADGVVATIDELARAFGETDQVEDPCDRSAFYRYGTSAEVINDGIGCTTTTPPISQQPDESRISLKGPTHAVADRVDGANNTKIAAFQIRSTSPSIVYSGDNSELLNKLFGGYLVQIQKIDQKLIATTENGCSIGSFQ